MTHATANPRPTDSDATPDDALDWQPGCQSLYHPRVGRGDASWAIWQNAACCGKRPDFGFTCDACLSYVRSRPAGPGWECPDCRTTTRGVSPGQLITRAVPLRKGTPR